MFMNYHPQKKVIRYLHACAGFPAKETWIKAIKGGHYATWPHLTVEAVRKHSPESAETIHGRMRNIKQGIRSTKTEKEPETLKLESGESITLPLKKHNDIYIKLTDLSETMYTD